MLLPHCILRADSRAACTAGKRRATRTPMMAITTSNSTRVKARRTEGGRMTHRWEAEKAGKATRNISGLLRFQQEKSAWHRCHTLAKQFPRFGKRLAGKSRIADRRRPGIAGRG